MLTLYHRDRIGHISTIRPRHPNLPDTAGKYRVKKARRKNRLHCRQQEGHRYQNETLKQRQCDFRLQIAKIEL